MRYVRPSYETEAIMTKDIICESPYTVAHKTQNVGTEEAPEYITVTEVTVDAGKLF